MNWLPRLAARIPATVHAKLLAAFLAIVVLLITVGVVGLQVLSGANRRAENIVLRQERIAAYRQFRQDTALPPTWFWNHRTVEATLQQLNQFRYKLDQLNVAAADDAALLAGVRDHYDRFLAVIARVSALFAAGKDDEARALQLAEASPLSDRLGRLTNDLVNKTEIELMASMDASQAAYRTSWWTVMGFAVGSIGLALVLGYAISWSLIGPVKSMDLSLRRIASGDLSQRVDVPNRDELGALAAEFNEMAAQLQESNARREERTAELTDTLARQTATGEVLRAISRAQTDAQPVFDIIAASALRLCGGGFSGVWLHDGESLHLAALENVSPQGADSIRRDFPRRTDGGTTIGRAVLACSVAQIPDVFQDPAYQMEGSARAAGYRSFLAAPMLHDGKAVGVIGVARPEPGAFPDKLVELLQTFAEQAVIAIENVRLFNELDARNGELREALEQQTATGEVLRVMSSSLTDVQPVFDSIARNAARLCDAQDALILRLDGDRLRLATHHGPIPYGRVGEFAVPCNRDSISGRTVITRETIQVPDLASAVEDYPLGAADARRFGYRTVLSIPLLRGGVSLGSVAIRRTEVRLFTADQIALLQTFADQAVIAIENVRLFNELEARNRELSDSLDQQTATSEILKVISTSPTHLQPVLDAVVKSAARFCGADDAELFRLGKDGLTVAAHHGPIPSPLGRVLPLGPATVAGRAVLEQRPIHVIDLQVETEEFPVGSALAREFGFQSAVVVPLLREGTVVGTISLRRTRIEVFTDKQIALLRSFADQAVIAMENVRLFNELDARTRDLTRSVGELRALGEVSQAVSSTLDLETVLATIVSRAVELSGSYSGIVYEFDEPASAFHARATHRVTSDQLDALRAVPVRLGEGAIGRAGVIREPVQVADVEDERQLVAPQVRGLLVREGVRSLLAVPLVREERLLGGLVILRREHGSFAPQVIATLQTFAAQSVLAMHNAGLFREIQRQKQYADALVETSPVAIATMDLRGTVVGWNPGAERLFGYRPEEAIGRGLDELVTTAEIRKEFPTFLNQALEGERIRTITRRSRKDGTVVDVEISTVPIVVDGDRIGFIAIYHDITELLRARREAEQANEAKSAFLATMSHEIRTPMNAVIGMSGLLLGTDLSDEQREYAEVVRQSGDALLTVINDILDFSKIEAGKLELESQPFDVRECVEGALDLVSTRAAEKGIDLAYLIGEGTPPGIAGDVTRLRQILLNLLSNAVKFTERGEVVLSVAGHCPDAAGAMQELTFSVRDTGIGIPAERLGRLFQSFSQVDTSTTRRYGGTGLGLVISQRLAELMGGRITVTSEVGVGSEFRFTIRAEAADAPRTTHRDLSGVQPSLRGKSVLVVDDNATNRRILTAHLDAWGMQARATAFPREALGWIEAGERYDLGILDMHMPEMDGVTLAHAIREHASGTTLPLILFTSLGRREARAESEGFAAYLNKPIKPSQLFDAIVSVLPDQPVHVPRRGVTKSELDRDMAQRHPLRILLAEDNVVNQKLALRLLQQMGYRADVAANGLEAIEAVERQPYDVVLMDVQMPELDGFEASREITRRWPAGARPRIVAMTANAMQGDRELCLAAGMDDYVSKPIRVEELVAALAQSPRRELSAGPSVSGVDDDVPPAAEGPVVDPAALARLSETMGAEFVGELVTTFVQDSQELIGAMRRALHDRDVDSLRRAAHSLKSNAGSFGANALSALARDLEECAKSGTLDGTGSRVERLAAESLRVERALQEVSRERRS